MRHAAWPHGHYARGNRSAPACLGARAAPEATICGTASDRAADEGGHTGVENKADYQSPRLRKGR